MSPALFRPTPEVRSSFRAAPFSALPVSILVHVLVLLALVVIPLLATDRLPMLNGSLGIVIPVVAVPDPPPQPVPAARRTPTLQATDAGIAPVDAPHGFRADDGLERPSVPTEEFGSGSGVVAGVQGTDIRLAEPPPLPPAPVKPVPVHTLLKPPVKLVDVRPVYPDVAVRARVEGIVIIEAVIGQMGEVREARVLRSAALLDEAALTAVRQWKFTPTILNGVPVPVVMTVTVNFTLQR
jgi:periplasmic protein TonB